MIYITYWGLKTHLHGTLKRLKNCTCKSSRGHWACIFFPHSFLPIYKKLQYICNPVFYQVAYFTLWAFISVFSLLSSCTLSYITYCSSNNFLFHQGLFYACICNKQNFTFTFTGIIYNNISIFWLNWPCCTFLSIYNSGETACQPILCCTTNPMEIQIPPFTLQKQMSKTFLTLRFNHILIRILKTKFWPQSSVRWMEKLPLIDLTNVLNIMRFSYSLSHQKSVFSLRP